MKEFWPHASHSQFITVGPQRWHIQQMGTGPDLLLIHGAGGATQSWRRLMPVLAQTHRCTAMDLPGQGFSGRPHPANCGVDAMAHWIAGLVDHLHLSPQAIVAHSAGGAIALRMAERHHGGPPIVAINAALSKFDGIAGWAFPLTAKLLAAAPFSAHIFAAGAGNRKNVERLLTNTGSAFDETSIALYSHLARDPHHVGGTLRMMADWALDGLITRLPQNPARVQFIVGGKDTTVPPDVSRHAAARMAQARVLEHPNLGHLAHEEAPDDIAGAIYQALDYLTDTPAK
ncbi:MAG: alpha/beta fold hydrolase BchO [Pseudomonadota bacterium]